ncbi:MAG: hypothetical protein HKN68_07770 [Saprospiraceae bacterium]|nr:hypothetical protein [Saprospiraceae bacterium]
MLCNISQSWSDFEKQLHSYLSLIFSHMVLEHLKDPISFHKNILKMTHKQTIVCHFFATKYGLPSMANLLLPSSISDLIIYKIQKRDPSIEGKYQAYYKKCIGPTDSMKSWYVELGYEIITYNGYLGHGYLGRFKWLSFLEQLWKKFLLKLNSPYWCSNAIVVMKRVS